MIEGGMLAGFTRQGSVRPGAAGRDVSLLLNSKTFTPFQKSYNIAIPFCGRNRY